ncbi:MAG: hypothetical protein AAB477_02605 [Patescibacteria group bacterium]
MVKDSVIKSLSLGIGDVVKIVLDDFYYKIDPPTEKVNWPVLHTGYGKKDEEDWIPCKEVTGSYCGDNYKQEPHRINIIKIRISKPFKMSSEYRNYVEFSPSRIISIERELVTA